MLIVRRYLFNVQFALVQILLRAFVDLDAPKQQQEEASMDTKITLSKSARLAEIVDVSMKALQSFAGILFIGFAW
jgi:hypothetical protein